MRMALGISLEPLFHFPTGGSVLHENNTGIAYHGMYLTLT